MPPGPPASRPPQTDLDGLSEKYWGDILERTVSSNSLHALQRIYGQTPSPLPRIAATDAQNHTHYHQHGTPRRPYRTHCVNTSTATLPTILKYSSQAETRLDAASEMVVNGGTTAAIGDSDDGQRPDSDSDSNDLCERHSFQHDAHCAKSKAYLVDSTKTVTMASRHVGLILPDM